MSAFKSAVKGLEKTLHKEKLKATQRSALESRHQALAPDMQEFLSHEKVVSALKELAAGVTREVCVPILKQHSAIKDYNVTDTKSDPGNTPTNEIGQKDF